MRSAVASRQLVRWPPSRSVWNSSSGLLSRLELTLSAGYAAAFESGYPTRHEGMLSLKILR